MAVSCLDCHAAAEGQQCVEHRGFEISLELTAKNCAQCHVTEYGQYAHSPTPGGLQPRRGAPEKRFSRVRVLRTGRGKPQGPGAPRMGLVSYDKPYVMDSIKTKG